MVSNSVEHPRIRSAAVRSPNDRLSASWNWRFPALSNAINSSTLVLLSANTEPTFCTPWAISESDALISPTLLSIVDFSVSASLVDKLYPDFENSVAPSISAFCVVANSWAFWLHLDR